MDDILAVNIFGGYIEYIGNSNLQFGIRFSEKTTFKDLSIKSRDH